MKAPFQKNITKTFFLFSFLMTISFTCVCQVWTILSGLPSSDALKAVHFVNTSLGWVAGENGTIMKTTNGGANWSLQNPGTTQTLRAIYFTDANNGWAAGDGGTIVATTNGGNNWQSQSTGTGNTLTGIEFVNSTIGWISGLNNTLLKTTNGGGLWTAQANQGGSMWGLSMLSATNGWSAGDFNSVQGSPRLLKTTNGTNWSNVYNSGVSSFNGFNDIQFTDANNGWVVGTNGIIRHTANAGATNWTSQSSGTAFEILSVDFINANIGYACGRQGVLLHTSDGGATWVAQYSGSSSASIWELDMIDATNGFAVGDFGITKYTVSAPNQPVILLQPNGAEIFLIGTKRFIIWQAQPSVNNVKIEYSIDGGNNWLNIVNSTPASAGSYPWNVPNNPSVNCLVRVSNVANTSQNDISNAAFYIMNSPQGIDYSVLIGVTVNNNPSQIILSWQNDLNALSYSIDRKLPADAAWTNLATVSGTTLNYTDNSVTTGIIYEYRVVKTTPLLTGYGYEYAGIEIPAPDSRGKVLIAINDAFTSALNSELLQLYKDLVGDGWKVVIQDFPASTTDVTVKNWVVSQYNVPSSDVQALIMIGHFAIPYSGNYAPDGHGERIGAQPADVYFADINGLWTDNSVITNNTGTIYNPNILNDGIWDQSEIPSPVELQVGRIDTYNMTGFSLSEVELIRQYLNKNHAFRHKENNPARKGLLNPHLDASLPATSAVGWRSFSPMLGYDNIDVVNTNGCGSNCQAFINALENNSYLWTYMAGGGTDTSCAGDVFTSNYCITRTLNTVFMQLYGSYFVEWANGGLPLPNNLLRAPLANNGMTLATCWTGGGPRWYFQHMGLGETIGYSTKQSQNNTNIYDPGNNQHLGGIHMALMGDPTLRLHSVFPISNLTINQIAAGLQLNWNASTDNNILGYNIYRSDTISGNFIRLNSTPITATTFTDNAPSTFSNNLYMVRAVKLETVASGTYYNMSTGIFNSSYYSVVTSTLASESAHTVFIYPNPVSNQLNFSEVLTEIEILDICGKLVVPQIKSAASVSVEKLPNGIYFIKSKNKKEKFLVMH